MDDLSSQLDSPDESVVLAALKELLQKDDLPIDTIKRLGPIVNKVRKMAGMKEAGPMATVLLQKWKPSLTSNTVTIMDLKKSNSETQTTKSTTVMRDPVRAKSVELFKTVLEEQDLAEQVEEAIYEDKKSVDSSYRSLVRSKYLNLKQNDALRLQLLSATLTPSRFVAMPPAEMASAELRLADRLAAAKALRDTQAACDTEAETDQFKCGRCGKRRCKYYQLQTRSADEPMTTFVTCVNCGNRWKFS